MKTLTKFIIICSLLVPCVLQAEEASLNPNVSSKIKEKTEQLVDIKKSIVIAKQDLKQINNKLSVVKEESDKKVLSDKKEAVVERLQKLTHSFEEMATGGVKISDYTTKEEKKPFNWQDELIDIFKPMMAELKALTERPRAIEALRTEKEFIEEELPIAEKALNNIDELKNNLKEGTTSAELSIIETEWQKRKENLEQQLKLVSFKLEDKLNPSDVQGKTVGDKVYAFAVGRGLTILLAVVAFLVCYLLFSIVSKQVEKKLSRSPDREKLFFQRAKNLALRFLTLLVALSATMLVLYIRGDWLILGLILIVIVGFAWALRTQLPKYANEVKLMLNKGSVREGERVNYNGIPWSVSSLNFFTELTNPSLSGGTIRLPISVIAGLNSRAHAKEEGWFPNEAGNIVILDNNLFGPVILQTPDIVQMRVLGGSTKTMSTSDYLSLNPRNLSTGFGVFVTFGLDYDLQDKVTTEIPEMLQTHLSEEIQKESFASDLDTLGVAFKEASGSSLDLLIITTFKGKAAGDYFAIGRFLQKATVDFCTEQKWNIPFDNVTVHLDKSN